MRKASRKNPIAEEAAAQAVQSLATAVKDAPEILGLRHETLVRVSLRKQRQSWRQAIAASLAVVVVGGVAWFTLPPRADKPVPAAPAPTTQVYQTAAGERRTITLADGSVAELDTRSRLTVSYTPGQRRVTLDAGQALFDVAEAPERPFIVAAGDRTITALGTRFDVRLTTDRLQVALIEGRVAVRPEAAAGAEARTIEMEPHQLLVIDDGDVRLRRVANIERFTSWRDGVVIFENATLDEAVAEVNRYSNQQIALSGRDVGSLRLSGAYRIDRTETFVEALELYFSLKVVKRTPSRLELARSG